ncbi:acyl-CoA thioesterase [Salinarimonas ramus]|uniref:4-hydroxybenzoyl-CoA thioesterase n=1 Tax=Salinarimonas ramus TaxID=690164 RepID=A0A917V348_9HYPH|nr:thioesterase family protein [Salinarimonas ramus]GGK28879.1 4-hydroxybenzoyl-CoA thioesterase [Salinarimonas ramus]
MSERLVPPARASLSSGVHVAPVKIRFSHCDPAGIVYYARWFDMLNGVLEDFFGAVLALPYDVLIRDRRIGLGYGQAHADYLKPGLMGDVVDFAVLVERIGGASIRLLLPGYRGEEPVIAARLVIVTTDLDAHKAIPVPDDLRTAMHNYQERSR